MNTDLLRSYSRWTDVVTEMRGLLTTLRVEGISPEAIGAWALHWDHQLYKGASS